MNEIKADSEDSAVSNREMKFYCINCGKQFTTYEEGRTHWLETKEAPINDIIIPIKAGKKVKPLGKSHD